MFEYKDLNGNSGITAYEIGTDYIDVEFRSGGVYRYTENSVGETHLSVMKALAKVGMGLNGYINSNVRFKYASRRCLRTENTSVTLTAENAAAVVSELVKSGKKVSISVS